MVMKKVVQSRWKGCSLSASQVSTLGLFSSRCRVAIDRGAFSDLEVSTVLRESDELEPTESDHQKTHDGDLLGHKSSNLPFVNGERFHSSKSTNHHVSAARYTRRARVRLGEMCKLPSSSDVKPKEKYCELIANVFRSDRNVQMKKADIVAILKSRYPYFKSLRKFECRISEVLTRNPAFKLIGPGMWGFIGLGSGNGQGNRSRKRMRVRRRPDFLRLEWKKPGRAVEHGTKRNLTRRQSSRRDTSTESEDESVKPETSFSSSLSCEDQRIVPTAEKDSKAGRSNSEIDICKEVLADFNKEILKRVIEEITKANKKCFENLITAMKATKHSSTTTVSERSKLPETAQKNNQQLLHETIDKLIADNEKCLMDLNQSTAEYGNSCVPTVRWPKSLSYETIKSTSMPVERACGNATSIPCKKASDCSLPKSESARSESDKTSKIQTRDDGRLPYPLPIILKHSAKANSHIKFGKRVIPRLATDSSADSAKNVSQSDSSEQDDPRSKQSVPGPKKRLVDLRLHAMKTISPSTSSTKKIRLSVDPSRNPPRTKCAEETHEIASKKCDHTTNVDSKKSVNDVFAEYARRNSELKDIVAMIDPTLSSTLNSQDRHIPKSEPNFNESRPAVTNLPRPISARTHNNTPAPADTNGPDERPSNKKINTGPTSPNKGEPATSRSQEMTRPSTSNRNPDSIIDVNPDVSNTSAIKYLLNRVASSGIQRSDFNQPTRFVSCAETRPGPSSRPIQPRSQLYTTPTQPRASSNGGIDIRYIPPYRWGYRPTGVTQQSLEVNPMYAPRGLRSYHVLYPSARPGVYSRAVRPQLTLNSAVPCRRGSALNDVRCRIRGATVLRFPVRK